MKLLILQTKNKNWDKVKGLFFKAAKDRDVQLTCGHFKDLTAVHNKKVNLHIDGKDLADFEAIYLRFLGSSLEEAALVAEYARQKNLLLFDKVYKEARDFDRKSFECLRLVNAGISYPKTFIGSHEFLLEKSLDLGFPLILKKTDGRKSKKVYRINSLTSLKRLLENYDEEDRLIIQEYIDNDFYLRLMVVGGEVIGAMKRVKLMGTGQGVRSHVYKPTAEQERLAISGAKALNLDIAGIDIMADNNGENYILEVNRSPQYITFMKKTGINVAEKIVDFFLEEFVSKRV